MGFEPGTDAPGRRADVGFRPKIAQPDRARDTDLGQGRLAVTGLLPVLNRAT
jgi:hypothetical protein